MDEFRFRLDPDRKPAKILFSVLLLLSAAALVAKMTGGEIVIFLFAIAATAAIFVFIRYIAPIYEYTLWENGVFTVTKIVGKKETPLLSFPLSSVVRAEVVPMAGITRPFEKITLSLKIETVCLLTVEMPNGDRRVALECDESTATRLSFAIHAAKNARHLEDEDDEE